VRFRVGISLAVALSDLLLISFRLFPITFIIVRDVRMVEDRSFEGVQPRQSLVCSDDASLERTLYSPKGETPERDHARARSRVACVERHAAFSWRVARLSIRASRNFYYRTHGTREGPANLPRSERFWKFCVLRNRGVLHWDSGVVHRKVAISIRATWLIFSAKICKAKLN
jgi:hypothetical protein